MPFKNPARGFAVPTGEGMGLAGGMTWRMHRACFQSWLDSLQGTETAHLVCILLYATRTLKAGNLISLNL